MSTTTPNLGLTVPAMGDQISSTIPALGTNFQTLDNQFGILSKNVVSVLSFSGVDPTGATDSTTGIQNAVNSVLSGGILYFPKGTYKLNSAISGVLTGNLSIVADPGTVIDGTTATDSTLITLGGSIGSSSALTANATRGARTINTALAVNPGDILLITSTDLFNSTRTYYYKGELVEVESVSAGTVTLKSGLYDSYNSATTTIKKINAYRVTVSNLTILRNSNTAGLTVQYAKDILLENISVSGARDRGIQVGFYVYGGVVKNCYVSDCWYSGTGTSYGLVIASSQSITVIGGRYLGGRHGISHGGNEPVRDITISGVTIGNHSQAAAPSFDIHGNADYINVHDCLILNGAELAGSVKFTNNKVYGTNGITYGVCWYGERGCEYVDIIDNYINANAISSSTGLLVEPVAANITINRVSICDNEVLAQANAIKILNPNATYTGFVINHCILENNYAISSSSYALQILNTSPGNVEIDDLQVIGGLYKATAYRAMYVILVETGTARFDGVTFVSNDSANFAVFIADANDVLFSKCNFIGLASSPYSAYNSFTCVGVLEIIDCELSNFSSNGGILYANAALAILRGNVNKTNVTGTPNGGTVKTITSIGQNGKMRTTGTAAPTTGTWAVGDYCENISPSVTGTTGSQYIIRGWACTAAGTPGTWVQDRGLTGT